MHHNDTILMLVGFTALWRTHNPSWHQVYFRSKHHCIFGISGFPKAGSLYSRFISFHPAEEVPRKESKGVESNSPNSREQV